MKLNIFLIQDQDYYIKDASLPIILKVTSNIEIKLAAKWDVRKVILLKNDKEIKSFFSAAASYLNREFRIISKDEPKYLVIDLSQYKDSLISIIPDDYQIRIEISLYEKCDQEYKIHNLQAHSNITLK